MMFAIIMTFSDHISNKKGIIFISLLNEQANNYTGITQIFTNAVIDFTYKVEILYF